MDIATLIGIVISVGAITWAMWEQTHGHLMAFYSTEGFVLVLGGSLAAVMLSMPMSAIVNVVGYIKNWLMGKEIACHHVVKQLVEYAEIARREGVLTLEKQVQEQKDPFLRKGRSCWWTAWTATPSKAPCGSRSTPWPSGTSTARSSSS